MSRLDDLKRLYDLLERAHGPHLLGDGRPMPKDARGVYFFFEPGEVRSDSGRGPRVVRVGTHAVSKGSKATLWKRLTQHRGYATKPGGNHRGSVFRLLIGRALIEFPGTEYPHWLQKKGVTAAMKLRELPLEIQISERIATMAYRWVSVDDEASRHSQRALIERNVIALLSNWRKPPLDPASTRWLGHRSHQEKVRGSGLWNSRHVDERYRPEFLDVLEKRIRDTQGARWTRDCQTGSAKPWGGSGAEFGAIRCAGIRPPSRGAGFNLNE